MLWPFLKSPASLLVHRVRSHPFFRDQHELHLLWEAFPPHSVSARPRGHPDPPLSLLPVLLSYYILPMQVGEHPRAEPVYVSNSTASSVGRTVSGSQSGQHRRLYSQFIMFLSGHLCAQASCLPGTGSLPPEHHRPLRLTYSRSVRDSRVNKVRAPFWLLPPGCVA